MITREQQGTVIMVLAVLILFGIAQLIALDWAWQQVKVAEQESIQIRAPYAPPSKDTIVWIGN